MLILSKILFDKMKRAERRRSARLLRRSIISLVSVLAGSLGLLAALDAGALIALSSPHFGQDACLGAASLETLQSAVQGLAFLDVDFGHLFSLPPMYPASSRILFKSHWT